MLIEVGHYLLGGQSRLHLGNLQPGRELRARSFLPNFPARCGKRRGFEGSLPPSQLQVEASKVNIGSLENSLEHSIGQWRCFTPGITFFSTTFTCDTGTLTVPSYSSGSVSVPALQEGVDKMPGKGTLEEDEDPGLGFTVVVSSSESIRSMEIRDQSACSHGFVTMTDFKIETSSLVVGAIREGNVMFFVDLEDTFKITIQPNSQP